MELIEDRQTESSVIQWMVQGVDASRLTTRWVHTSRSLRSYHQLNAVTILEPDKPRSHGARENAFEISKARKL